MNEETAGVPMSLPRGDGAGVVTDGGTTIDVVGALHDQAVGGHHPDRNRRVPVVGTVGEIS